ncbi:hypothetical protein IEO21_00541 [Rhodonia placenta]|uniref:Uncharacterized protein n=2 Tax=Rhodonia placenta TaxID=104341 RepID=A0A1X6N8G1_9APHY|nr:hypothetical protein POSPLADRAFT_1044362 [Postia placenta MAD-698-R-SB12]KAF9821695.1 hypothetical protein IEO21_00541 [Postia placenta]OSX64929.1 hypothetical protein POSPLADRAFT_1044362 [Postia placenta MAD-698-R-SB12]
MIFSDYRQQLTPENTTVLDITYKPTLVGVFWRVFPLPFGMPVCIGHALLRRLLPPTLASYFDASVTKTLAATAYGQFPVVAFPLFFILVVSAFSALYMRWKGMHRPRFLLYVRLATAELLAGPCAPIFVPTFGAAIGFIGMLRTDMVLDKHNVSHLKQLHLTPNAAAIAGWYGYAVLFVVCKYLHVVYRMLYKKQRHPRFHPRVRIEAVGLPPLDILLPEFEDMIAFYEAAR